MYKQNKADKTTLQVNDTYEGETIEKKINRIVNNKEPIKDGAPLTYTDRRDGVKPEFDIRTDRFELAVDAMEKVQKSHMAKRTSVQAAKTIAEQAKEGMNKENEGLSGADKIQATD